LKRIVNKYPITGNRGEALANVGANNYATSYYRLSAITDPFQMILDAYLENPDISKEDLQTFEKNLSYDPEEFIVAIELFMSGDDMEPDEELIDQIALDIENIEGLPRAKYAIYMHDNLIDKTSGRGSKENSIKRGNPELIIKE
ncbi:DUF1672 family protein, partial [Microvirga sp. 3-52]|nr:DUF1672 family protein [Microvirga sp. 3-52]